MNPWQEILEATLITNQARSFKKSARVEKTKLHDERSRLLVAAYPGARRNNRRSLFSWLTSARTFRTRDYKCQQIVNPRNFPLAAFTRPSPQEFRLAILRSGNRSWFCQKPLSGLGGKDVEATWCSIANLKT